VQHATTDACVVIESSFYTPDSNTRAPAFGETSGQRFDQVQLEGLETVRLRFLGDPDRVSAIRVVH
jgi:hypothetical protein